MSIPDSAIEVPEKVHGLAAGAPLVCVWVNDYGGMTFRADPPDDAPFFVKYGPRNAESNMRDEADRMRWARRWTRVPEVLAEGRDDSHEWLVTRALPGLSAVDPRWVAEPETAVRAIGIGLRALHDALPVESCPWDWSVEGRIANAERRGIDVPARFRDAPPVDRLVVCHADACCPNTLLDDRGDWLAHVDLGLLGTGDRWADLAVASMSTAWDYGPGWEDALVEAYGLEPDRERLAFYRDLWNAT